MSRVGNGSGLGWWHHSCSRMTFQGWRQRQGAGRHVKPGLHKVYEAVSPDGLGGGVLKGVVLWARLEGMMRLGPHEAL